MLRFYSDVCQLFLNTTGKKANIFIMQKTQNFSKFIATYD